MLACNAAAVLAMLVALTQRDDMVVDATLRHYLARPTAAGARDEALSRLHSSAHTVRHPPRAPDDAFAEALEDARAGSSMADVPRSTLRALVDPQRSTLERAARGDVAAGVLGDGKGEDELHVLLRARPTKTKTSAENDDDDAETTQKKKLLRATCELQRAVTRARGYGDVCRKQKTTVGSDGSNETCMRPWSVLDVRGAYEAVGLGGVLDALGAMGVWFGAPERAGAFERARDTCVARYVKNDDTFERNESSHVGASLCADAALGSACDARGCDDAIHPARRACAIAGFVEACDALAAMTREDVRTLEFFHLFSRNSSGGLEDAEDARCDVIATSSRADVSLRLGEALTRWAEAESRRRERISFGARTTASRESIAAVKDLLRSPPPLATLAAPWSLLVDSAFFRNDEDHAKEATRGASRAASNTGTGTFRASRVIFFLGDSRDDDDGDSKPSPAARWVLERAAPVIVEPFADGSGVVAASWHQASASKSLQTAALWRDVRWAAGSLGVTALLVAFHANDFRLAFGAIAAVSASLVAANYAYACVFQIHWVGALNFLGCFVIFAIGADDAFVLVEFWRKSETEVRARASARGDFVISASATDDDARVPEEENENALLRRMRWTLAKSGYAVTMTSATTALAFAGNLASSVTPVRLFGAYMATLVACDYWLVCTSVPSLLVLQAKRRERNGNDRASTNGDVDFAESVSRWTSRPPRDDAPASPSPSSPPASPSAPPLFPALPPFATRRVPFGAGSSTAELALPPELELPGASILARRTATVGAPPRGVARPRGGREPSRLRHRRTRSTVTFAPPPLKRRTRSGGGGSVLDSRAPGDVVLDLSAVCLSDDDFATPRSTFGALARTASRGDPEAISAGLGFPPPRRVGNALSAPPRVPSGASVSEGDTPPPGRSFSLSFSFSFSFLSETSLGCLRDARDRVALETAAFATLRRGGAECVAAVAFACVLVAAVAARHAAPPEMASATATSLVEDGNAKAFRVASGAFSGGVYARAASTRVAFVFGARDAGAHLIRDLTRSGPAIANDDRVDTDTTLETKSGKKKSGVTSWTRAVPDAAHSWTRPLASFLDGASRGVDAAWARVSKPLRDPDDSVGGGGAPTAAPPAFDDAFDVAHPDTQLFLLRFCDELRAMAVTGGGGDGGGGNDDAAPRRVADVSCFADALDARLRFLSGGRARLPLARGAFESAARTVINGDDLAFSGLRWWSDASGASGGAAARAGDIATVEVRIATTTSPAAVAARDLHAERAFWRHWFANATADAPPSLGVDKGFVTSRTWALLDTEAELATNAWSALGASLFCAFVVVLIAARSARLACLATFSVGAVAASFVAFLVAAGHTLGVAESTCVAVLVGLSLDYVLHVAGAYAQAPPSVKKNRRRRAFWATRATGASVFAGATTTAAAASFLLFQCDAPFFRTFGAFALWTSSVSSVFAVVVFPATCALWGHEARDAGERRRRYVRTVEEL